MRTHGVGIWVALVAGAVAAPAGAQLADERSSPERASDAPGAEERRTRDERKPAKDDPNAPAYVDSNLDDKAARVGRKAKNVAVEAGAQLSDGFITSKVKSKLMADEKVDASGIDVDTSKRIVYLKGRVSAEAERARAVEIAKQTKGVYGVIDELQVGVPSGVERAAPASREAAD
jgi:hypothetical protein